MPYTKECKKYFAYGSNMFEARLRDRIRSAKVIGTYKLPCHDLRFHKRSDKDKSGKCDAYETGNVADFILGRLFYIEESEECKLDEYEGLGTGYEKKSITVGDDLGNAHDAFTYYADCGYIETSLRPYTWYREHVLAGAKEGNFPAEYIKKIKAVSANKDPCPQREKKELDIHEKAKK